MRPSASATLAAASSNKSIRSAATPALVPAAPVKKPSPSPSIKRGKAERLLKEHGSPPGMRVTAGGRIVPSDLPPVLNNRFVNDTFRQATLRGVPLTSTMSAQPRQEASNVPRLEVVGSQPVLYVGDRAYALPALDATNMVAPPPNPTALEAAVKPSEPASGLSARSSFTGTAVAQHSVNTPSPLSDLDLSALKAQQTLKKQELRTVEQTEVLQASHQTEAWRAGVIEKKRNLIIELDGLRKQITAIEAIENHNSPAVRSNGFAKTMGPTSAPIPPTPLVPQFQQPISSSMYGFPSTAQYPHMMMFPPPFGGYPSMPPTDPPFLVQNPVQPPQSPGSAGRRSHAIQIKPPPEEIKKQLNSALDPKSPTYEPAMKTTATTNEVAPATPSPAKRSPWRTSSVPHPGQTRDQSLSQKPSLSSIDTTDFFPTNTHEHSSTRAVPQLPETKTAVQENSAIPSTPEKNWPASPWNEGNSSRSSHKAVAKLTSWPEAFGKKLSSVSLEQLAAAPSPATLQERIPHPAAETMKSALTSNMSERKTADQRFGTEETWPLINSKPISHVPSTYQEGFQAGYDHVGIPDSPDVLKGYISGLVQFLHDEDKKGRNTSLRGLVATSQPHDSAFSMTSNRADAPNGQENIRSAKVNAARDVHKESTYPTPTSAFIYTLSSEVAHDQRMRNLTPNSSINSAGVLDRTSPAYLQTAMSSIEKSLGNKGSEQGTLPRAEANILGVTHRHFSANQPINRIYGTPMPLQRYNETANGYDLSGSGGIHPSFTRAMANQRVSGLDGAMDDLAEMASDVHINGQPLQHTNPSNPPHTVGGQCRTGTSRSVPSVEEDASCFRPSTSKGKQKMASSPVKSTFGERSEAAAPSSSGTPGSPRKSGEHSPAKAKLEQVTNKFRRKKKDARNLSPEQKKERARKWRERFRELKDEETKSIQDYKHASSAERR